MVIVAHTIGSLPLFFSLPNSIDPSNTLQVAKYLGNTKFFIFQMLPFLAVAIVLILFQRFLHNRTMVEIFTGRTRIDFKRVLFSFSIWGLIMLLSFVIEYVMNPKALQWNFNAIPFVKTVILLIVFLPIQVLAEELLFRGFILPRLNHVLPYPWIAIVISGILFGLVHAANPEVLAHGYGLLFVYGLFGIFLSFLAVADNGLELPYGFHVANNFFQGIVITSADQAFQLNGLFKSEGVSISLISIIILMVSLFLFLVLCYKVYPWSKSVVFKNNN